jgi:uncharacterized protein (UPF0332 family)
LDEGQKLTQTWLALAEDKLQVARDLLELSHFDDAVSRAYYAMFYAAKAALLTTGSTPRSHSGVLSQFSQHFVMTGRVEKELGRMLSQAMQAREASDYNAAIRAFQSDAQQAIADAETFVAKIKEIFGQLPEENTP